MADRNPYHLSILPVDYSLTHGSLFPAPLNSPPESPESLVMRPPTPVGGLVRPPTPFGGPLSSHPACPEDYPGTVFPPTPEADKENICNKENVPNRPVTAKSQSQASFFKLPISPASAASPTPSNGHQRRPSVVRKLLSISSLRSSFNSSRISISLPQPLELHNDNASSATENFELPSTPSDFSIASSYTGSTSQQSSIHHCKPRPVLQHRKSTGWFKRKSSLLMGAGNDFLNKVNEDQRPDTRDSKRIKVLRPAPSLPEVKPVDAQQLGSGEIGWCEEQFR
ncbi:Hypothetical protein R9X50_00568100 [Acrodontium crateriforme]|uniref:Uncharacterized protein n=1 Tax=Acrodontium crateriforme TaxID=150365 RepID=A0AAQ3M9T2_9PEZI|nr:Hypothetical protein R9X50_00568100 [Acrodontium crateriforme]